jgi:polysaccharide export outer membrane protein
VIRAALRTVTLALCVLLGFATAAAAQEPGAAAAQPSSTPPSSAAPSTPLVSDPDYVLGQGDVVGVMVVGSPEFNTRSRVSNDGTVVLPLIGQIQAAGLSQAALAGKVSEALKKGGYYASPIVRVELLGIQSRYVTVLGNVGQPGLLPLDRNYRLSEIVARVGGRTAAGADFVVLTPANGEPKKYAISNLATGGSEEDPVVSPGDKIYIPPAENEVVYLNGEVRSPGAYAIQKDMTVRIALAKAGGVSENGSEKKVKLVRDGKRLEDANLETKVQPGDVITFGARLF